MLYDSNRRDETMDEKLDSMTLDTPPRWTLIRDALVFQAKLFVDGVRDLLLAPIAFGALILDLLGVGGRAGRHFYNVMLLGRQSEEWIDLFKAADRPLLGAGVSSQGSLDSLVERLEAAVVQEYERGGITASAKHTVDRALDGLARKKEEDA